MCVPLSRAKLDGIRGETETAGFQRPAGGAEGNRTPDLCSAIAALSHLSYSPAPFAGSQVSPLMAGLGGAQIAASPRLRNAGIRFGEDRSQVGS